MNAAPPTKLGSSEIEIFSRIIETENGSLSRQLARYLLKLEFGTEDQKRMRDLAARNQEDALSSDERDELDSYVRAGHLLALLHSKARKSLR